MNETAQIIIIAIITVLTIILTFVGVQIILVLKEFRQTLLKVNGILKEAEHFTTKLTNSTQSISGLFVGIRTALSLLGVLKKDKDIKDHE